MKHRYEFTTLMDQEGSMIISTEHRDPSRALREVRGVVEWEEVEQPKTTKPVIRRVRHHTAEKLRCQVCGETVKVADIREHLVGHSPIAEGMDWEDVHNQFELVP